MEKNKWLNVGVTFNDPELLQAAKDAAAQDDRSLSAYIRQLVREDLIKRGMLPGSNPLERPRRAIDPEKLAALQAEAARKNAATTMPKKPESNSKTSKKIA